MAEGDDEAQHLVNDTHEVGGGLEGPLEHHEVGHFLIDGYAADGIALGLQHGLHGLLVIELSVDRGQGRPEAGDRAVVALRKGLVAKSRLRGVGHLPQRQHNLVIAGRACDTAGLQRCRVVDQRRVNAHVAGVCAGEKVSPGVAVQVVATVIGVVNLRDDLRGKGIEAIME